MRTLKYYSIELPFVGGVKEKLEEYNILATNKHGKLVINDFSFTTLQLKKAKYSSNKAINEITVYKSKWGWSSDGWNAYVYFQCSEKVMRRRVLTKLKKEMSKEIFLDSEALRKLEQLIRKKV